MKNTRLILQKNLQDGHSLVLFTKKKILKIIPYFYTQTDLQNFIIDNTQPTVTQVWTQVSGPTTRAVHCPPQLRLGVMTQLLHTMDLSQRELCVIVLLKQVVVRVYYYFVLSRFCRSCIIIHCGVLSVKVLNGSNCKEYW